LERGTAVVIGAGVVGLAVAYWLSEDGIAVTVVDRDPSGDKASFGNAAGIAVTEVVPASVPGLAWRVPGWLVDPLGRLPFAPPMRCSLSLGSGASRVLVARARSRGSGERSLH
jgi:glycine/D-amino acid oxidase-like deaminating enzyme